MWQCVKTGNHVIFPNESVLIFIWDENGNIKDYVSATKPYSQYLTEKHERNRSLVIYHHDIGESSCSQNIRELVRLAYEKQPHSLVISFDFSGLVSIFFKPLLQIPKFKIK